MKNPLTKEQIRKINEIAKLPLEKQKIELQNFLKTLSPEQIEFLKKQQKPEKEECIFCSIIKGAIPAKIIYEDTDTLAFLDINPVNKGHTLVVPKKHYETLLNIPDDLLQKLILVIKKLSELIYKEMKADGFNFFTNNYKAAGQLVPHFHFHIIPRFEGDGYKHWEGKKIPDKEMNLIWNKLKNKIEVEEKEEEEIYKEIERIP